jgi:hypothetical protein
VLGVEPDPEPPDGRATVLRLRECLDCGELIGSREEVIAVEVVRRRFDRLAGERMGGLRAVRKALSAPAPAV